jgi:hypothetical protein
MAHINMELYIISRTFKFKFKKLPFVQIWSFFWLIPPYHNIKDHAFNMRQAQHVWRTKSCNFKRGAWEGNGFFFKYFLKFFFIIIIWLELSLFDLWLFRSFYLRRSSAENLVERYFLIRILFQVYFDFA